MKFKRGCYDVLVRATAKFPSNIALRVYENGSYKLYTYSELYGICEYIAQNLQQLISSRGVIGILAERNVLVPCTIAAIHKCSTTFMFLNPMQNIDILSEKIKFKLIIVIDSGNKSNNPNAWIGKSPDKILNIFDISISFYKVGSSNVQICHSSDLSFIATTSGSTGEPKHIHVPMRCIIPNIDDLTSLFLITANDVINFSTPLTFDPSMVEILLAFINGASLLIAPRDVNILFQQHSENSVTFWQTTPSMFFQYSDEEITEKILAPHSTLKILAFGGEPMTGISRLKELKQRGNRTKLYALYGVTEMSCWACVTELNLEKLKNDEDVPLGHCLSETQVVVRKGENEDDVGKIMLLSKTRKCYLLHASKPMTELTPIDTGDLAFVQNGTVYYRGRRDDLIKRFGNKIHLRYLENFVTQHARVRACCCVWLPKPMQLVLFFSSNACTSEDVSDLIKNSTIGDNYLPDKVIRVDSFPVTEHGKICKQTLTNIFNESSEKDSHTSSIKKLILKEIRETLSHKFEYEEMRNKDFFSLGGSSFLAVALCNKLSVKYPFLGKACLPLILQPNNSIEQVLKLVETKLSAYDTSKWSHEVKRRKRLKRKGSISSVIQQDSEEKVMRTVEFNVLWKFDMGKCVDASPTLFHSGFNLYVTVGSHSGFIVVSEARQGLVQSKLDLKSRIEASVCCYEDRYNLHSPRGFIGTHNGTIVSFLLDSGAEVWRTNIKSMIKSKAACYRGFLYVASYDGIVRCINYLTGEIIERIQVCDDAISADLAVSQWGPVLVATLSGICACIDGNKNTLVWQHSLESPVFAAPKFYNNERCAVFLEVSGKVHGLSVFTGTTLWTFDRVQGNIFSSVHVFEHEQLDWQMVFGCHDSHIYSLKVTHKHEVSLQWKCQLSSEIYATPCGIFGNYILAAPTNGELTVLDKTDGTIISHYNLPNKTFSSPTVWGEYVYIGCRDDFLYAIKYSGHNKNERKMFPHKQQLTRIPENYAK